MVGLGIRSGGAALPEEAACQETRGLRWRVADVDGLGGFPVGDAGVDRLQHDSGILASTILPDIHPAVGILLDSAARVLPRFDRAQFAFQAAVPCGPGAGIGSTDPREGRSGNVFAADADGSGPPLGDGSGRDE